MVMAQKENTSKEKHHMIQKNRFAILLISFLLITWFTPFILRDNIASAVIVTPTLTTQPATGIGITNATLNGNLINKGNDSISSYGFQYGLTTSYSGGYIPSSNLVPGFSIIDKQNERNGNFGVWGDGTYLYATNNGFGNSSLYAYSFNGIELTLLDTYWDVTGDYRNIWGDGTYLYVSAMGGGIRAFSFDGATLTLNGSKDDGGDYYDVYGDGTYIYTSCTASGIRAYTFDGVTNTFTLVDTQDDGADYFGVWTDGSYIYSIYQNFGGAGGIRAYTFIGSNFVLKDTQSDGNNYLNVWGDGTYIYTACLDDGIRAYTFIGLNFVLVDTQDDGGYYYRINGDGNYIYVADYNAGFPGNPDILAYSFDGATFTLEDSHSDGEYYYTTVWTDGVYIYASSFTDGVTAYTFGTGPFSSNLTGLSPGTFYHYRSFANNSGYTGYGNDMTFYTNIPSGAYLELYINVFNESNGSQAIPFNILIKNLNGTQVYSLLNQHNTCHIVTLTFSSNQTLLIKVWYTDYRERIINVHLGTTFIENFTFYLPRESLPPGGDPGGGSGFYPYSNITATSYNIRVVQTIATDFSEFDRPIAGAWINVSRFINATGRYELMSSLLTDTNGYANLYLISSVLYLFDISADGFISITADWNPPPVHPYQLPELKIFRLEPTTPVIPTINYTFIMQNITWSLTPTTLQNQGAIPFSYHIISSDGRLQWYRMTVYYLNVSNNTWVVLYNGNASTSTGGYLNYTTPNITGRYKVELYFKKIGYHEYKLVSLQYTIITIKAWIKAIPDFVWYLVIIILMIMIMGFCYTKLGTGLITGYIGLFVFAFGLLMKPGLTVNGFSGWAIFATTFVLYTMGMFLWSRI